VSGLHAHRPTGRGQGVTRGRFLSARTVALVILATILSTINALALVILFQSDQVGVAPDYQQYVAAVDRAFAGEPLYGPEWKWRYAPVATYLMAPVVSIGLLGWSVLHVLALLFVRPWWLAILMLVSWPFWVDVVSGNTVTFVVVAGLVALRGSTSATYVYWALCLLIPRPFQLPLALYLLWRRRDLWRGAAGLAFAMVIVTLVVGQGSEWIAYLLERGAENTTLAFTIHPAADWGAAWLLVGIPGAILLTLIGWPGLGGIVLSPSLLPQYLLIAVAHGPSLLRRGVTQRLGRGERQ
jgi:hypothetical protein